MPYVEGSKLRFVYSGENKWRVYTNDKFKIFSEIKRFTEQASSKDFAQLNLADTTYLVPLAGGETYLLDIEGQPVANGEIEVGEIIKGPVP